MSFIGVKAALLIDDKLVAIQRDDIAGLKFAGLWDLPGGAREDDENPFECLAREVKEELSIDVKENQIIWQKVYPAIQDPSLNAYFMAIRISESDVANIKLGDEGQGWRLMKPEEFLQNPKAIGAYRSRLEDYLAQASSMPR